MDDSGVAGEADASDSVSVLVYCLGADAAVSRYAVVGRGGESMANANESYVENS